MMLSVKYIKTLAAAAVMAFSGQAASATTISFDEFRTGTDLGSVVLGTLQATQVGTAVEFVYTNTASVINATNFTTQLFLTYVDSRVGVSRINISGVASDSFLSTSGVTNAGLEFQFRIGWPESGRGGGALRLNPGESSTFQLLNTTLAGFFQGDNSAMIHLQGLEDGGSTKYVSTPSAVPIPAAGFLLLAGLGGLAAMRRRKTA
jgi:hypothetical protein